MPVGSHLAKYEMPILPGRAAVPSGARIAHEATAAAAAVTVDMPHSTEDAP